MELLKLSQRFKNTSLGSNKQGLYNGKTPKRKFYMGNFITRWLLNNIYSVSELWLFKHPALYFCPESLSLACGPRTTATGHYHFLKLLSLPLGSSILPIRPCAWS